MLESGIAFQTRRLRSIAREVSFDMRLVVLRKVVQKLRLVDKNSGLFGGWFVLGFGDCSGDWSFDEN